MFNTTYSLVVTDNDVACSVEDDIVVNVLAESTVRVNGVTCDPSEVRNDTIFGSNQFGCDSMTIFNFILLPSDTFRLSEGVCDSLDVGVDTLILTNRFDCDSIIITTFFPLPKNTTNLAEGTCDENQVGIVPTYLYLLDSRHKYLQQDL